MIDDELIRQLAASRGIEVSDSEVDERIGEQFNYFGGESPTPAPTATATVQPTPSLTPIPTDVITDVLPTNTPAPTPTVGPTGTPPPTPTPVSEEAFVEEYDTLIERYRDMGVSEETFRSAVRAQIFRQKLADQLGETEDIAREAEMASIFVMIFESDERAQEALGQIEDEDYLEVWNRIRSQPAPDAAAEEEDPERPIATELLWRTQEQIEQQYGADVAEAAFTLPIGEPSEVLTQTVQTQDAEGQDVSQTLHYIIQVSGREVRDLSEAVIENEKQQLVTDLVTEQRQGGLANIVIDPVWRARVPTQPILDPSFLAPPPTQPAVAPTVAPAATATSIPEADE
jgi:hypothetical protein